METQRHGHRGQMACEDLNRVSSYAVAASQGIIPRMASDTGSRERQDTSSSRSFGGTWPCQYLDF